MRAEIQRKAAKGHELSKTVMDMCLMLILHQGISSLHNIDIGIGYQTRIVNSRIDVSTKSTKKNHTTKFLMYKR
jgi:hypothetical protein